jgi:carboxyl-terminal processing protease
MGEMSAKQSVLACLALALVSVIPSTAAFGCEGATTIFEDSFSDASGGWSLGPNAKIENSSLVIEPPPGQNIRSLNVSNTVNDADICADVIFPAASSGVGAGLMVWATDYNNFYALQVQINGEVSVWRFQNGKWFALRAAAVDGSVKRGRDQLNDLRVRATNESLTFFVNGKTILETKGKAPGPDWHFGVYGQNGTVLIKHFKVTSREPPAANASSESNATQNETYGLLTLFGDVFERVRADYVDKSDDWKLVNDAIGGMLKSADLPASVIDEKTLCADELTSNQSSSTLLCFGKAFERAHRSSPVKLQDGAIVYGALTAMVGALDSHSEYLDPKRWRDMQVEGHGGFGGVGVELAIEDGFPKIVTAFANNPADRAGIKSDDVITQIDGSSVRNLSLNDVVDKLRGPVNSEVKLTILRKGADKPLELSLARQIVDVSTVHWRTEGRDVGYIQITQLNVDTYTALKAAMAGLLKSLGADSVNGYVLDLRNSTGGLLDQAISVSDAFLNEGEIVATRGREAGATQRFNARPGDLTSGKPLIVLINGVTAAGSEIIAGALHDHRRATVIGTRSFGAGTIQTIIPLGVGNGALRITTARFYFPSGRPVEGNGITPDIVLAQDIPTGVKLSPDSYVPPNEKDDKVLHMAIDLLRGAEKNAAFPPVPSKAQR